jgi:galactose mutarotase-like enzyme
MFQIENDLVKITISPKGAELKSIWSKNFRHEYMWNGDPAFWGKTSPVLFPIVGTLKDGKTYFDDKPYTMGRHGFARDADFTVTRHDNDTIDFTLESDVNTMSVYPFPFSFTIRYALSDSSLRVSYFVTNKGNATMYFSVGGHPAFRVPLQDGLGYTDYYLLFDKSESAPRWPISADGLIETKPLPFFQNSNRLPLSKELFYKDALVFKDLVSGVVSLRSDKSERGWSMDFHGFPYLGIWAARNADFVCVEPWCGIADSTSSNQQLTAKEGIEELTAGDIFERSWTLTIF